MSPAPNTTDDRPPVPAGADSPRPSSPHPQPSEPEQLLGVRRANPLTVVLNAVRGAWGMIVLVVFGLAPDILSGDPRSLGILVATSAVILVASVALSLVAWRNRTWELTDEGIVLCRGAVNKRRLQVPYEHIHTIQMNSGPLERLVGLMKLDFDTGAAAAEGEATTIEGLRAAEAQALREEIFRRKRATLASPDKKDARAESVVSEQDVPAEDRPLATYRLETRELLLAAASQTSAVTQAGALVILLVNGANQLSEWGVLDLAEAGGELSRIPLATVAPLAAALLVLAILIGGLASFVINLIRFGGYRAGRYADHVTIDHGLLSRSSRTLAPERVQYVTIRQGLLRQLMGYVDVRAQVVASPGETDGELTSTVLLHPFLRASEVDGFLSEVLPSFAGVLEAARLGRLEKAARRRAVVRKVAWWPCTVALAAAVLWLAGGAALLGDAGWLLRPLLVVAAIASVVALAALVADALLGWTAARYGHTARELVLVSGGLTRQTAIVPRSRLQRMELARSPFQRRAGVTTLSVRTASVTFDGLSLRDLPEDAANELLAWFRPRA